jgi:hypothetical protein
MTMTATMTAAAWKTGIGRPSAIQAEKRNLGKAQA